LLAFLESAHLLGFLKEAARVGAWLILISLVFLPLERLFAVRPRKFFRKSLYQDLSYYFINGLVPGILIATPLALVAWGAHYVVPWPIQTAIAAMPLWERVAIGFVVGEVGFYWGHRWSHKSAFLWRFHSIHHSAEEIYFLVSARAHPLDNVFVKLCGLIPACILGVASPLSPDGTWVPLLIVLVATLWGFFIHSNFRVRLGPFEWLLATPAFHHWHHTRNDHKDHNYASMLPIMDWLFGTFYLPAKWPGEYGTDTPVAASLAGQLFDPMTPWDDPPPQQRASKI